MPIARYQETTRRNHQVVRVLRLLALLEQGHWTREELAEKLGTTVRTLYRDLAALDEAHIGWKVTRERGGPSLYTRDQGV